jgi:hypothetical protein
VHVHLCLEVLCSLALTFHVPSVFVHGGAAAAAAAERLIMQELEACKAAGLDAKWVSGPGGGGGWGTHHFDWRSKR